MSDKENSNNGDDPLVGKVVDEKYQIVEFIGAGGMGRVYKARHLNLNKTVALKTLRSDYMNDSSISARFKHEATVAGNITNPHVVAANDYGRCENTNTVFIAMDYVVGTSLKEIVDPKRGLDIERAVHIVIQLCDGIAAAHKKNVLHRDIKPSNILLTDQENDPDFVKITDFGIAKVLAESEELKKFTKTADQKQLIGTSQYMSPEQCQLKDPDYRSDVYSIGCVLFELLTGKVPFDGGLEIITANMHITAKVPELQLGNAAEPVKIMLKHIVYKALEKEPDMRYQTINELQTDLKQVESCLIQLRSAEANKNLLLLKAAWLSVKGKTRKLFIHLYFRRKIYSKLTIFCLSAAIVLIALLFISSLLGTFGSHYDMRYQPILREMPKILPSKQMLAMFVDSKDKLPLYLEDADTVRRAGDLRLSLTLYDKAESKAAKLENIHSERTQLWLGRMISCLFLERPKLTILCAPVCFDEFAKTSDSSSNINFAIAHAFYGQALSIVGKNKESIAEFQTFNNILQKCLQRGKDFYTSDELAYACGFAGIDYEKQENITQAELLLERAGDYWKAIGLPGKYNLAITHMNLASLKIKTNQYQEAYDLIENAISDLNESGEMNIGFRNKLQLYAANLKLKLWIPIVPILF